MEALTHKRVMAVTNLKLCEKHVSKSGCALGQSCNDLHVCKFYLLSGSCKIEQQGKSCKFGHNLDDPHNKSLLEDHCLECLPLESLSKLFQRNRTSALYPKTCKFFNNVNGCQKGRNCLGLHVCKHYILGDCRYGPQCRYGHSLSSAQPMGILKQFGFDLEFSEQEIISELRKGIPLSPNANDTNVDDFPSVQNRGPPSISSLSLGNSNIPRSGDDFTMSGIRDNWGQMKSMHPIRQSETNGNLPAFWNMAVQSDSKGFHLVPITKEGSTFHEFEKIETQFFESMSREKYRIKQIQRIQNSDLYARFQACKARMAKRTPSGAVEEKFLFHGTKKKYIKAICFQGFDFRESGTSTGCVYGHGSYFAKRAHYSRCYTDSRQLFVARVLVGQYAKGISRYTRPPPKDPAKPDGELYDSCVDDTKYPKIFVLFAIEQAYLEYLIDYKKFQVGK